MANKVFFNVLSRPSKEKAGRTDVLNRETRDGVTKEVLIGTLTKVRGAEGYEAFVTDAEGNRTKVDGTFVTRSQGGHAVSRAFYADERAAKAAKRKAREDAATAKKAAVAAAKAAKAVPATDAQAA